MKQEEDNVLDGWTSRTRIALIQENVGPLSKGRMILFIWHDMIEIKNQGHLPILYIAKNI